MKKRTPNKKSRPNRQMQAQAEMERRKRAAWPSFDELSDMEACFEIQRSLADTPDEKAAVMTEETQWREEHAQVLQSSGYQAYLRREEAYWESDAGKAEIQAIDRGIVRFVVETHLVTERGKHREWDDMTFAAHEQEIVEEAFGAEVYAQWKAIHQDHEDLL